MIGLLVCTFALFVFLILRMTARAQINQSGKQKYSLIFNATSTVIKCLCPFDKNVFPYRFWIRTLCLISYLILFLVVVHDLYRAAIKRLCHCNQAADDCEYTPLVTCDEETEETGHDELMRGEPVHRVVELQS